MKKEDAISGAKQLTKSIINTVKEKVNQKIKMTIKL